MFGGLKLNQYLCSAMYKADVENILEGFYPKKYGNRKYVSRFNVDKKGNMYCETMEWHNRVVQYCYNDKQCIVSCTVIKTGIQGLSRTTCVKINTLGELRDLLE